MLVKGTLVVELNVFLASHGTQMSPSFKKESHQYTMAFQYDSGIGMLIFKCMIKPSIWCDSLNSRVQCQVNCSSLYISKIYVCNWHVAPWSLWYLQLTQQLWKLSPRACKYYTPLTAVIQYTLIIIHMTCALLWLGIGLFYPFLPRLLHWCWVITTITIIRPPQQCQSGNLALYGLMYVMIPNAGWFQ